MSSSLIPKAYESANIEAKWFSLWNEKGYFKGVVDNKRKPYSIVIPPPNVTGILTLGHVLNNTLQDILIRWRRMQGYSVCWFPGTDHAGIATESRVEKMLREKDGTTRRDLGREKFIERVWEWKKEYGGTIIEQLKKLGCSCDWERERFTLDEGLSNAVKKVFVELYNKGYIYKGVRMINWCPVSRTALSDEEVIHREVNGAFYHFKYPFSDGPGYMEIATTRPETMLGDTAVAVNPNDERYKHLVGKTVDLPLTGRKIPIIADDLADPSFGTGCLKITPAHDPNDFIVGKKHGLEVLNIMNDDASINDKVPIEFVGLDRFACRKKIVAMMEQQQLLVKIENHKHNVGYSERGDVPVEPRVSEQWFVNMKELAKPAIEAVRSREIKFYPDRWSKVYFNWMENIQDWCISRQIWWGHRIPAWTNIRTGEIYVGMDEPENISEWKQDNDVLDTWFSSWLWPFSIMGWPEETKEQEYFYPTCDLVTGPDIIFFWVARMIMAGIEFKGAIPFSNVYFTSIIRDSQGRKLSKSLGNSPDPLEVIANYGADALRFSIIYIAPVGLDIRYSNDKCELGRNFANKIWNACRFRQMHGETTQSFNNLEDIDLAKLNGDDKWILFRLNSVIDSANTNLEKFNFQSATHELYNFVWNEFCDWYIESSKSRIYGDGDEKQRTLSVLDYVLFNILKLLHPFMPFITEELAHFMGFMNSDETIMFASYPTSLSETLIGKAIEDKALISMVESKFELVKAGRNMRAMYNIPPAKKLIFNLKTDSKSVAEFILSQEQIIKTMLNSESISINSDDAFDGPAPSSILSFGTLYLPLKEAVDIPSEVAKLNKQKKELEGWIMGSRSKLSNPKFVDGAPAEVVNNAKEHLAELEAKLVSVCDTLKIFTI